MLARRAYGTINRGITNQGGGAGGASGEGGQAAASGRWTAAGSPLAGSLCLAGQRKGVVLAILIHGAKSVGLAIARRRHILGGLGSDYSLGETETCRHEAELAAAWWHLASKRSGVGTSPAQPRQPHPAQSSSTSSTPTTSHPSLAPTRVVLTTHMTDILASNGVLLCISATVIFGLVPLVMQHPSVGLPEPTAHAKTNLRSIRSLAVSRRREWGVEGIRAEKFASTTLDTKSWQLRLVGFTFREDPRHRSNATTLVFNRWT